MSGSRKFPHYDPTVNENEWHNGHLILNFNSPIHMLCLVNKKHDKFYYPKLLLPLTSLLLLVRLMNNYISGVVEHLLKY